MDSDLTRPDRRVDRIGRYRLGPLLGAGGAGRVYAATMTAPGGFERPVALKLLEGDRDEARREARLGGLLRHRNLVDVYEIGSEDGTWFCAMELCPGGSLAHHLPLAPAAAVEAAIQVCDALTYAHETLGLVHLDVKPDNLLLSERAEVKLADLGISQATDFESDGRVRGTPGYMAPEQARGAPVDARADVYALGVTLVQLVTGSTSTADGTLDWDSLDEVGSETMELEPVEADSRPGWVPDWLTEVVHRCIEPHPDDRWQSMVELREALEGLRSGLDGPGLSALELPSVPAPVASEVPLLVGRTEELAALRELVEAPGVVMLEGPPGVGKTRLLEALDRELVGPSAWVDLATARDAEEGLARIAAGLGLEAASVESLVAHLGARPGFVLMLDGVERVEGFEEALASWRARCPETAWVVGSQVHRELDGNRVVLAGLGPEAARELLLERAAERGVTDLDVEAVDALCEQLDGLPLALELAAGRLGVLELGDIQQRLGRGILRSASEGRHATLEEALEWSWEQVDPPLRAVLAELCCFAGGFSLDAAQAILTPGERPVAEQVARSTHSSWLAAREGRFHLLRSMRRFLEARTRFDVAVSQRHAAYYADLAARLEGEPGAIFPELPNLEVALERALDRGDGTAIAGAYHGVYNVLLHTGPWPRLIRIGERVLATDALEAAEWSGVAVRHATALTEAGDLEAASEYARRIQQGAGAASVVASTHRLLGNLFQRLGKLDEALGAYRLGLELHRRRGEPRGIAHLLNNVGMVLRILGRFEAARQALEESCAVSGASGDRICLAMASGNLGIVYQNLGQVELARSAYQTQADLSRAIGDRSQLAIALGNLATVDQETGDVNAARAGYEAQRKLHEEMESSRGVAIARGNLGTLLVDHGMVEEGLVHLEAAREAAEALQARRMEVFWIASLARAVPVPRALALLERAESLIRPVQDPSFLAMTLAVRAEVLAGHGLPGADEALAEAESLGPVDQNARKAIERARAVGSSSE